VLNFLNKLDRVANRLRQPSLSAARGLSARQHAAGLARAQLDNVAVPG